MPENQQYLGDYQDCDICGKPFTDQEWEDRHSPNNDPMADVHAACCPDCKKRQEADNAQAEEYDNAEHDFVQDNLEY